MRRWQSSVRYLSSCAASELGCKGARCPWSVRRNSAATRASNGSLLAPLCRNRSRARSRALGLIGYTTTPWSSKKSTTRPSGRSIAAQSSMPLAPPLVQLPAPLAQAVRGMRDGPGRDLLPGLIDAPHRMLPIGPIHARGSSASRLLRARGGRQSLNGRLPLYGSSGGPLSLEPRAPFSCGSGRSVAEPPGAPTRRVLGSASSDSAPVPHVLMPRLAQAHGYYLLPNSGRGE